jgi:GTPase-activating protein BEM2
LLRKKYLSAQVNTQSTSPSEIATVVRARSEVLETMNRWIHEGGGAQDALDYPQLLSSFIAFFSHPTDHEPPEGLVSDYNIQAGFSLINDNRKAVYASFTAQTMRPTVKAMPDSINELTSTSFSPDPPDIDNIEVEELVGNLDAMAAAAFRNVTQEVSSVFIGQLINFNALRQDLFVTADILEVQSADRTGWFATHEPSAISDEVEIQSIHTHLQDVEPSTMISDMSQDSLYRLLPPAVRGCIRAYLILRKWVVSKLVTRGLGLRKRQARMELILQAIEVCRLRNTEPPLTDLPIAERPCIRSLVESVLVSAVVSVESRTYHRAWQSVAGTRGTTCDTLLTMLIKPTVKGPVLKDSLTVDMGWILERMIEIISLPDVVDQDGLSLVNLDKRRYVFYSLLCKWCLADCSRSLHILLTSSSPNGSSRRSRLREVSRRDFDRLNRIEADTNDVHFDLRLIREDAYREVAQSSAALIRRQPRPFHILVLQQQEKNKRDRSLRDKLSKEKRQEQHRQDKREEYLNKAMQTRRPLPPSAKQHRNKKSVSSAFLHFMRPISSAFISDTLSPAVKRTPAELDFTPTHKPAIVLNIVDARAAQFINNERSFTFQLDTEDGGHYLLQALDKADMKKWIDTINRVSKTAAKRRLTYLGHNSKMAMSDHLFTPGAAPRDPRAGMKVYMGLIPYSPVHLRSFRRQP